MTANIDLSKVPGEHVIELRQLLQKYSNMFAESSYDIQKTILIVHEIDMGEKSPIKNRFYRAHKLQNEFKLNSNKIIEHMIIQENRSLLAGPDLLENKSMSTDQRKSNKITKHDSWSMLRV